jgi:hypothetical protein
VALVGLLSDSPPVVKLALQQHACQRRYQDDGVPVGDLLAPANCCCQLLPSAGAALTCACPRCWRASGICWGVQWGWLLWGRHQAAEARASELLHVLDERLLRGWKHCCSGCHCDATAPCSSRPEMLSSRERCMCGLHPSQLSTMTPAWYLNIMTVYLWRICLPPVAKLLCHGPLLSSSTTIDASTGRLCGVDEHAIEPQPV